MKLIERLVRENFSEKQFRLIEINKLCLEVFMSLPLGKTIVYKGIKIRSCILGWLDITTEETGECPPDEKLLDVLRELVEEETE